MYLLASRQSVAEFGQGMRFPEQVEEVSLSRGPPPDSVLASQQWVPPL